MKSEGGFVTFPENEFTTLKQRVAPQNIQFERIKIKINLFRNSKDFLVVALWMCGCFIVTLNITNNFFN